MSLILEKGYSAVTVEDITERADLGRTTFYLHFHDKDELLVESLEAIAEDLKAQVEHFADQSQEGGRTRPHPVAIAFRHAEKNRDLYRIILKGEGSSRAASRIRDIIQKAAADFFMRRMAGMVNGSPDIPGDMVAGYFASAMLGFITWWLEKDIPYSGDEAADLFVTLFFRGARQVLHLNTEV